MEKLSQTSIKTEQLTTNQLKKKLWRKRKEQDPESSFTMRRRPLKTTSMDLNQLPRKILSKSDSRWKALFEWIWDKKYKIHKNYSIQWNLILTESIKRHNANHKKVYTRKWVLSVWNWVSTLRKILVWAAEGLLLVPSKAETHLRPFDKMSEN